jgi:hypothetical protein
VNGGTDALVLLLRACGLCPGYEVVVPAFSFIASASSVVPAGGAPVFADIEPDGHDCPHRTVRATARAPSRADRGGDQRESQHPRFGERARDQRFAVELAPA